MAEANLQRQGFETYLPWYTRVVRQRGACRQVVEPLFPRYLFLRIDTIRQTVAPIRSTLGVSNLVTFGQRLPPVPDFVIDTLRHSVDGHSGPQVRNEQEYIAGQSVIVVAGPFEGLQGVFYTSSGEKRVAILLDVLGRSTRVVLTRDSVAAV